MAKARPIRGLDPCAPAAENARIIARVRLEELLSWERYVDDPQAIQELHNLRIAAKRLRYTLEIFADLLPAACERFVGEMEAIQDELGALHDSDVLIALLQLCLADHPERSPEEQQENEGGHPLVRPELVADLLDPGAAPSDAEKHGLACLLSRQEQLREEQYAAFRRHWRALRERDFSRELLEVLET